ncbi:MAG: pantetheine-phosphate adenylyltransferase [Bacteroidota bacterium]
MRALYAGTFDPVTYGHLDIIERARQIFGHVFVVVAENTSKNTLFTAEERVRLIQDSLETAENVEVGLFRGLLVDKAAELGDVVLIRGIRQVSDFDYELRMAFANRRLAPDTDTLFFAPSEAHAFVTSSLVREIHRWGGDVSSMVPGPVLKALKSR